MLFKSYGFKYLTFLSLIIILIITGCKKESITPENTTLQNDAPVLRGMEISNTFKTYILGHKGAGSNNYNDVNMEHSIASFKEALAKNLDGVEVDVQMSLDGTLWLFHDTNLIGDLCNNGPTGSLINMHDKDIKALQLCSRKKHDRVYKFSELIDLWNNTLNGFYISFEIKGDFPASTYNLVGGESVYLKKVASKFAAAIATLKHSPSQFIIEDDDTKFTNELKKYPIGTKVKYVLFEDQPFDQCVADAIKYNFDGVSCSFGDSTINAARVKAAHDKKLLVQLWTPYYDSEVLAVYKMHPDFIQTDHTGVKADLGIK